MSGLRSSVSGLMSQLSINTSSAATTAAVNCNNNDNCVNYRQIYNKLSDARVRLSTHVPKQFTNIFNKPTRENLKEVSNQLSKVILNVVDTLNKNSKLIKDDFSQLEELVDVLGYIYQGLSLIELRSEILGKIHQDAFNNLYKSIIDIVKQCFTIESLNHHQQQQQEESTITKEKETLNELTTSFTKQCTEFGDLTFRNVKGYHQILFVILEELSKAHDELEDIDYFIEIYNEKSQSKKESNKSSKEDGQGEDDEDYDGFSVDLLTNEDLESLGEINDVLSVSLDVLYRIGMELDEYNNQAIENNDIDVITWDATELSLRDQITKQILIFYPLCLELVKHVNPPIDKSIVTKSCLEIRPIYAKCNEIMDTLAIKIRETDHKLIINEYFKRDDKHFPDYLNKSNE